MNSINQLFEYLFFPLSIAEQNFSDEQKEETVFAELQRLKLSKSDALSYATKFLQEYHDENNYQFFHISSNFIGE